jgi:hypothetical protein
MTRLFRHVFPPRRYHHRAAGPVVINPDVRERIHVWGPA